MLFRNNECVLDNNSTGGPLREQAHFRYQPLSDQKTTIRLCRLLPGLRSQPVCCELVEVSIDDSYNSYDALSYEWGTSLEARFIRVDGQIFATKTNVRHALLELRWEDAERILWIDGLCINQKDDLERGHQVGLMGKIYSNARTVRAWLGAEPENSSIAFEYLKSDHPDRLSKLLGDGDSYNTILNLRDRKYWSRAWIKQEILLAKSIDIHCGRHQIPWSNFREAVIQVTFMEYTRDTPTARMEFLDDATQLLAFRKPLSSQLLEPYIKNETLQTLLLRFSENQASQHYDLVFALLSLASDCQGLEADMANYTISGAELFLGLLRFCQPNDPVTFACFLQGTLQVYSEELYNFERRQVYWKTALDNVQPGFQRMSCEFMQKWYEIVTNEQPQQVMLLIQEAKKSMIQEINKFQDSELLWGEQESTASRHPIEANFYRECAVNYPALEPTTEVDLTRDDIYTVPSTDILLIFRRSIFGFPLVDVFKKPENHNHGDYFDFNRYMLVCDQNSIPDYLTVKKTVLWIKNAHLTLSSARERRKSLLQAFPDKEDSSLLPWILAELNRLFRLCLISCSDIIEVVFGLEMQCVWTAKQALQSN